MQWIAIFAALGWTVLQVFILFISIQCIYGVMEIRPEKEHSFYQAVLTNTVIALFLSLFILPLVSVGLFYYAVFNITGWHELLPAILTFAMWWVALFTFSHLSSVKRAYLRRYESS